MLYWTLSPYWRISCGFGQLKIMDVKIADISVKRTTLTVLTYVSETTGGKVQLHDHTNKKMKVLYV